MYPSSVAMAAQNKAALAYFVQLPVNRDMVKYLAARASEVICCAPAPSRSHHDPDMMPPTPPSTPPSELEPAIPTIEQFIINLVHQSHVQVPTLMTSLVYLARLRARLPPQAQGMRCSVHRIFLAALILAAKNLNDSSPKNKHWARYTWVPGFDHFGFSTSEVNLMEKQLLYLLDWDMRVNEDDLYTHLEHFLAPIRSWQSRQAEQNHRAQLAAIERQYVHTKRPAPSNSVYDSPVSMASSASSYDLRPAPPTTMRSTRSYARLPTHLPSRMPSLSPSRSDSCASAYDTESLASTPASSTYIETGEPVSLLHYDAEMPSLIHIEAPAPVMSYGTSRKGQPILPFEIDRSQMMGVSKKAKTSTGNIFSRFLYNRQSVQV